MHKINPIEKFGLFTERWSPKIVAELNGQHVKLVKSLGSFPWHHHDHEDEMFLVVKGPFNMEYRDAGGEHRVTMNTGEFIVVPRGVEHRPVAEQEAWIMLFEPAGTLNTGNAGGEHTVAKPDWI
jgi:mannose-6-phosphate isomerase-like protein (cupin superfamily)